MPRYNAMLAVLRNTLYMYAASSLIHRLVLIRANRSSSYGGIFERGSKEYTLDDFYALSLDKLDRFTCLKPSNVIIDNNADDESSDEDDEDEDEDNEDDDDAVVGEPAEDDQQTAKKSDNLEDIVEEVKALEVSDAEKVRFGLTGYVYFSRLTRHYKE